MKGLSCFVKLGSYEELMNLTNILDDHGYFKHPSNSIKLSDTALYVNQEMYSTEPLCTSSEVLDCGEDVKMFLEICCPGYDGTVEAWTTIPGEILKGCIGSKICNTICDCGHIGQFEFYPYAWNGEEVIYAGKCSECDEIIYVRESELAKC